MYHQCQPPAAYGAFPLYPDKLRRGVRRREQGEDALAEAYLKTVASGDRAKLCSWCCRNEGMDGRSAADFVDCAMERLGDMLCGRKKTLGLSVRQLEELYELLERCSAYLRLNVGVKHIFGLLAVDSIAGGGNRG